MYAYRPRRNAQQAIVEVQEQMYRGYPMLSMLTYLITLAILPQADMLQSH